MPDLSLSRFTKRASRAALLQTASQGISSVNNLVLTLAITTQLSLDELGAFNLPFVIYLAALGIHRALIVEPILASTRGALLRPARRLSIVSALSISTILVTISIVSNNEVILTIALTLPALLLVDLHRNWAFNQKKPTIALLIDLIWLFGTVTLFILPLDTLLMATSVWAGSAAIALLVSFFSPMYRRTEAAFISDFLAEAKGLAAPSVIDSILYQIAWQIPVAIALNALSVSVAGAYRLSTTIMAPLLVIVNSWNISTFFALRSASNRNHALAQRTAGIAVVCAIYIAVVSVGVFVAQVGEMISLTLGAIVVLVLVALQTPLVAINSQIVVWHKVHRLGYHVLICRFFASIPLLIIVTWGVLNRNSYAVAGSVVCGLLLYQGLLILSYRRSPARAST